MAAWLRRQRFEARLLANAVAETLGGGTKHAGRPVNSAEFLRVSQG